MNNLLNYIKKRIKICKFYIKNINLYENEINIF